MKKKLTYKILSDNRTLIMGFAIISIIIFHYARDCMFYHYHYHAGATYINYIGSVGVDIFLMVSALGLYYSFKKNSNLKQFFYKRYTRVLIPYLLVAVPTYIWVVVFNHYGFLSFFKDITFLNLFHRHDLLFWYIFFISFCYLIFPVLFNYIESSKNKHEVLTKIIVLCIAVTLGALILGLFEPHLFKDYNLMFLRFLPFFVGLLLGYLSYHEEEFKFDDYLIILLGLGFILLVGTHNMLIGRYSVFFYVTSLMFIFLFILVKCFDKFKIVQFFRKIIEWFGKYSLEIYLLHVVLRKVFATYGFMVCRVRWWALYIAISLLLVPVVHYLTKKIQELCDKKLKPRLG